MPAVPPPAAAGNWAENWDGAALAGAALYLLLFAISLLGTWRLLLGGPAGAAPGSAEPGDPVPSAPGAGPESRS